MPSKDKENMFIMNKTLGDIRSVIKNNQMEILGPKKCNNWIHHPLYGLSSRFFSLQEKRMKKLDGRLIEVQQSKEEKEKLLKKWTASVISGTIAKV